MRISILTLFPEMFSDPFDYSIVKRAKEKNLINISLVNIRDFAQNKHKTVDDKPYGGGTGMIMKVDVVHNAIESVFNRKLETQNLKLKTTTQNSKLNKPNNTQYTKRDIQNTKVVLLDPKGETFTQKKAQKYSKLDHLILVCGHYEGIDARIENFVDEIISIGNYVLTGGEIPAMVITNSVIRLIPNVLKKSEAIKFESFSPNLIKNKKLMLEYPQYTRPDKYKGYKVPKVLLSGNHKQIENWKKKNMRIYNTKY